MVDPRPEGRVAAAAPRRAYDVVVRLLRQPRSDPVELVAGTDQRIERLHADVGELRATVDDLTELLDQHHASLAEVVRADQKDVLTALARADEAQRLTTVMAGALVHHVAAAPSEAPIVDGPLVSIVLPVRDRPEELGRALRSVLAQSYPRWELIVVDDGSADPVSQVLRGIVGDDERGSWPGPRAQEPRPPATWEWPGDRGARDVPRLGQLVAPAAARLGDPILRPRGRLDRRPAARPRRAGPPRCASRAPARRPRPRELHRPRVRHGPSEPPRRAPRARRQEGAVRSAARGGCRTGTWSSGWPSGRRRSGSRSSVRSTRRRPPSGGSAPRSPTGRRSTGSVAASSAGRPKGCGSSRPSGTSPSSPRPTSRPTWSGCRRSEPPWRSGPTRTWRCPTSPGSRGGAAASTTTSASSARTWCSATGSTWAATTAR